MDKKIETAKKLAAQGYVKSARALIKRESKSCIVVIEVNTNTKFNHYR